MPVANLLFNRFIPYCLYARYLRLSGSNADHIPFCVVTFIVALAFFSPMRKRSINVCASTLKCLSVNTNVLLSSNVFLSNRRSFVVMFTFCIIRSCNVVKVGSIE